MSYRSKRTMSNALPTEALERPKRPTLVSQSLEVAASTIPSSSQSEEIPKGSNKCNPLIKTIPTKGTHTSPQMQPLSSKGPTKLAPFSPTNGTSLPSSSQFHETPKHSNKSNPFNKNIPPKGTQTSPQMPLLASKGPSKWGPFSPPTNGVPTTLSPSFSSNGVVESNSIWKAPPKISGEENAGGSNPKRQGTLNTKHSGNLNLNPSITNSKNPSQVKQTAENPISNQCPRHVQVVNEGAAKNSSKITGTKPTEKLNIPQKKPSLQQENVGLDNVILQEDGQPNPMQEGSYMKTRCNKSQKSVSFKSRLPRLIPGWPNDVEYDVKEEVLTVGNNHFLLEYIYFCF